MKALNDLRIQDLAFLADNLPLDVKELQQATSVKEKRTLSYLLSYPYFIDYFSSKELLYKEDLIIGGSFTYAWMPTVLVWKTDQFSPVVDLLNKVKVHSTYLTDTELTKIKDLINGSIVGTSKLLHFINPDIYPIWDSKINKLLRKTDNGDTNSLKTYTQYVDLFRKLKKEPDSFEIKEVISQKTGYDISFARAFEMILFLSAEETLKKSLSIPNQTVGTKSPIPRYKRDQYIFISNLNNYTADEDYPLTYKRDGYLLSEHYMSRSAIKLAEEVKRRDNLLISDNGNFSRIKKIAATYDDEGLAILNTARKEMIDLGQLSTDTIQRRKMLMDEIGEQCQLEVAQLDITEITTKQLSIKPDYIIGMEDYAIPTMMLANLMHPVFSPAAAEVKPYQQRTLSLYTRQESGAFGSKDALRDVHNFLVLHAYDYDSAFQAASLAKEQTNNGVAISYGGPMLSKRWINSLDIKGTREVFTEKLPESYLIAQSLTLGIINGNPNPIPYHILGVGTPILIALIGYQLRHASAVSIDSTAPFKDAFAGTLYGDKQAYIKMDMYRVAAAHLIAGTEFKSTTPFFKFFNEKYPADWATMREKMKVTSNMNYKQLARDLEERLDLLEQYLPFFSKMRSGNDEMMLRLRVCRSGHNFWILRRITKNIIKYREDPAAFQQWIEKQVDRYTATASYKWAKAVAKTYELTEKHRAF